MTLTLDELHARFVRLLTPDQASVVPPDSHGTSSGAGCTADPAEVPGPVAMTSSSSSLPAPTPPPVPSCRRVESPSKGYHFEAFVTPALLVPSARILDAMGYAIDCVTGVDWLAAGELELVYDFYHPESPIHVVLRCRTDRNDGEVPTLSEVYPGANWHEREAHDFFGIRFTGHPDLSPFLLPEDATYHPLRKDFTGVA